MDRDMEMEEGPSVLPFSPPLGDGPPRTFMEQAGTPNAATEFLHEFHTMISDRPLQSGEELQTALAQFARQKNNMAQIDFLGLSPEQMHRLRHSSILQLKDIVKLQFPFDDMGYSYSPVVAIAVNLISRIILEGPVKLTSAGNLPRKVVHGTIQAAPDLFPSTGGELPAKEDDVPELMYVHRLLQLGDIIGVQKKELQVLPLGREFLETLMETDSGARFYRHLLLTCLRQLNWLYVDCFEEPLSDIQHSAVFNLLILKKKAKDFASPGALARVYARAMPVVLHQLQAEEPGRTPEVVMHLLEQGFLNIFLRRFCSLTTSGEWREAGDGTSECCTSPLFDTTFQWQL